MKTVIIGLDAFDPVFFESLHQQNKLPNLGKFVNSKGYAHLKVSNPPQSEVSWTSIATGLNPGEHGMFDFVHRNPTNYSPYVSLLPTGRSMGGIQFVSPYNARTIFDAAVDQGYPATSMWWPATFPARPNSPARTLPGLGAPDIQGRLGIGTLYTSNSEMPEKLGKTPVLTLEKKSAGHYSGRLSGPLVKNKKGSNGAHQDFELIVEDKSHAKLALRDQTFYLSTGEWSPIFEIKFKLGLFVSVSAISRLVITQLQPHIQCYVLPLQIHPLRSPWRYGTPRSFVKDSWKSSGPFLTLGWPQDTTGLDNGCINDEQFLSLCDDIFNTRLRLLKHHLNTFNEGLLACVFDSLDRIQHMFWHIRPDIIEQWYIKLDAMVGIVQAKLAAHPDKATRLLVVSDHGFKQFTYKVNLNRWLIDNNFLAPLQNATTGDLKKVDWEHSKAYAIGLNSVYLNIAGREGRGIVSEGEKLAVASQLQDQLAAWQGPDGRPVVQKVWQNQETFTGALSPLGPDLVIGYTPGYRASSETGLGAWEANSIIRNEDHWGSDHCFNPAAVPGVLFSNRDLTNTPHPSYKDIPALAIDAEPDATGAKPPPTLGQEDQEKVEERLKSLGYL